MKTMFCPADGQLCQRTSTDDVTSGKGGDSNIEVNCPNGHTWNLSGNESKDRIIDFKGTDVPFSHLPEYNGLDYSRQRVGSGR